MAFYKRALFTEGDGCTLQDLVQAALALDGLKVAKDHAEHLGENTFRLINMRRCQGGVFMGSVMIFERGRVGTGIVKADGAEELPVYAFKPGRIDGKETEIINSLLFFAI